MRWLGVVGLAVACGGPQADPEVPCVPFDEIPIVNESGWDETEVPDLIPGVLEAFARDSGHTCLHLTELRVVDYIEPSESGPPFVAGRHRRSSGTILLQSRAGVQTIRHELCHALLHVAARLLPVAHALDDVAHLGPSLTRSPGNPRIRRHLFDLPLLGFRNVVFAVDYDLPSSTVVLRNWIRINLHRDDVFHLDVITKMVREC